MKDNTKAAPAPKRTRRKANAKKPEATPPTPAPVDVPKPVTTLGDTPTPTAPKPVPRKNQPTAKNIPAPPAPVRAAAIALFKQSGVPEWLTYLIAWTGSRYGEKTPAPHNWTGCKAAGSEPKRADGYAWYGKPIHSFGRVGWVFAREITADATDAEALIKALKPRFPKIDSTPYTLFQRG